MNLSMFDLSGKVALVTGGNSGLGLGYAKGLAKAGAKVMIWGRRTDKNELALAQLNSLGSEAAADSIDVSDEEQVKAGIARVIERFGRIDTVVVNAGFVNPASSILDLQSSMYHALLDVNLHGSFYTLKAVAEHMVTRAETGDAGGSIIICGSLSINKGVKGLAHYAAAKGALNAMSKTLAVELGPKQIRVNVVAPGFIATDMTQADPAMFKQLDEYYSASTPIGRVGQPEDFEGIAVYLASDSSRFHTGDTLIIDGGNSIT